MNIKDKLSRTGNASPMKLIQHNFEITNTITQKPGTQAITRAERLAQKCKTKREE